MKHMKKIASLLLALVMAFAMTTTVFAAVVNNTTGHTYDAYQIFSGTQETDNPALGDVKWGNGINETTFLPALQGDSRFILTEGGPNIFASCATAADVAAVLGNYTDNSDVAEAFANVAASHLTATKTAISDTVTLVPGYYLLVDTTNVSDKDDARNPALLQVTNKGDITIAKKYSVPTVDKSVQDSDDTWGEAADWHIGDDVPFELVGTLPSNYADYESYKYVFHDTLSSGLKYNGDAKVSLINGDTTTDISSSFTITPSTAATTGGGTLTIACDDLKDITAISSTSTIVVEYTAELLSTAEIGTPGNDNKVKLEFTNNPNHTGEGTPSTGKTPEDTVLVFTYELDVTKIDGQKTDKKLKDAEFVLFNSDKTKVAKVSGGKFVEWVDASTVTKNTDGTYPADYTLKSAETTGLFTLAGLDAGTYYLRETKAPAGYNLLKKDIEIVITATLNKDENNPGLTALTLSVKVGTDGTATSSNGNLETGIVSTDVENNSGATLPETGGTGTTVFYVLGGVLVLGAIVLLVVRKRMSMDD